MSNDRNRSDRWNATRDPGTIREWGEDRGIRPYRQRGEEEHDVDFHRPEEAPEEHEELEWNRLGETLEERGLVFLYRREQDEYELMARDDAVERATMESDAVEEALMDGETIETELVETKVIETEVVESETIESEVVDTELLESEVIESETVDRNIVDTAFVREDDTGRMSGETREGDIGTTSGETRDEDVMLEVDVEEVRSEMREQYERVIVESEVVESDVVESDTVETDAMETTVDVEGVERHLLESDIVGSSEVDDVVDTDAIESRMMEGEVVESEFIKRTVVEEEVADEHRERYVLEDSDRLASESVESTQIESAIVEEEAVPAGGVEETTGVETTESPGATPEATDDEYAEGEAVGSQVDLSDDDVGKTVVDEHGTDVGVVSAVKADQIRVNPEPGITDRIKAKLGWGDDSEDTYAIGTEQISRVEDDDIVLQSI